MPYGPGGDPGPLDYSDEITGATAKERAEYENWKRKEREERKKREEAVFAAASKVLMTYPELEPG